MRSLCDKQANKYNYIQIVFGGSDMMDRKDLIKYIIDNYGTEPDYPWDKYPAYEVFRHSGNNKWFALIMDVSKNKLGLKGSGKIDIVNLKCDPIIGGSLRNGAGIFPAYHMNKENWVTVALDGSAPDDTIKMLLDISYDATVPKIRPKRR